jgi:hypothetical protein
MTARWTRDKDGDYCLRSPRGEAWISEGSASRSQPKWYGRATDSAGAITRISAWSLRHAKQKAESALELKP